MALWSTQTTCPMIQWSWVMATQHNMHKIYNLHIKPQNIPPEHNASLVSLATSKEGKGKKVFFVWFKFGWTSHFTTSYTLYTPYRHAKLMNTQVLFVCVCVCVCVEQIYKHSTLDTSPLALICISNLMGIQADFPEYLKESHVRTALLAWDTDKYIYIQHILAQKHSHAACIVCNSSGRGTILSAFRKLSCVALLYSLDNPILSFSLVLSVVSADLLFSPAVLDMCWKQSIKKQNLRNSLPGAFDVCAPGSDTWQRDVSSSYTS